MAWKFLLGKIPARTRKALKKAEADGTAIVELEPVGLLVAYINVLTERLGIMTIRELLASDPDAIMTKGLRDIGICRIREALLQFHKHDIAATELMEAMMPNRADIELIRIGVVNVQA